MKLDGSETPKPTPFDAHEQVARGPHQLAPLQVEGSAFGKPVLSVHSGLVPEEYQHQEYPKVIAHDPVTGSPIIANSAAHEAELTAPAADEAEDK